MKAKFFSINESQPASFIEQQKNSPWLFPFVGHIFRGMPDFDWSRYNHSDMQIFHLTATSLVVRNNQYVYGTNTGVELAGDYMALIIQQESVRYKDLSFAEQPQVIHGMHGSEIKFVFNPTKPNPQSAYKVGDKIGQLLILPLPMIVPVADNASDRPAIEGDFKNLWGWYNEPTSKGERGTNGFGSSGE